MRYKESDRKGNKRSLVEGTESVWLSEPELSELKLHFARAGLQVEFYEIAFAVVDCWLTENPKKLAISSRHIDRLKTWGLNEALKQQTQAAWAKRAAGNNQQRHYSPSPAHNKIFKAAPEPRRTFSQAEREQARELMRRFHVDTKQ